MQFDSSDMARVTEAIRLAESRTSAEIFCVLARASGTYRVYPLLWALVIALLVPLPLFYFAFTSALVIYAIQLAAALGLAVFFMQPRLALWMVPASVKRDRARGEAQAQFAAHGLNRTTQRTGILIFMSAAERHAEIVADAAINEKVPQEAWNDATAVLMRSVRRGQAAQGFIEAIDICGRVLAEHFPPGALSRDELPNKLVVV